MSIPFPHPVYSEFVLQHAYRDAREHLFDHMLDAHDAHAVMLCECDIITPENAAAIFGAVQTIREEGADALAYEPGVEDLFFRIESLIIEMVGPDYGGNLQLARSRNDLGHALERMAFRQEIISLYEELLSLRRAVLTQARTHLSTLMPGYTHTQPAQPVTFAHYLVGIASFLAKDQGRLASAYANMNESPLGAAAFTGTGFPIDRMRVAELLGFDAIVTSTHHSIGAGDNFTDLAFAIQSLCIGLSRVTHDLLNRATAESNALYVHDSFVQISSIMPQKRNPVVLEHLRARLSRAIGYAQTVVMQCHSIPYGDTQDIEDEIIPPLQNAIEAASECVQLYTAFFETVKLNEEHLRRQSGAGFTTATELADTLVRDVGLPFRLAHKVVTTLVQTAVRAGISSDELTIDMLQTAANEVLDHELDFTAEQMAQALDPEHFVRVRTVIGGVAPDATADLLDVLERDLLTYDLPWATDAATRLSSAASRRAAAMQTIQEATSNGASE